MKKIIIVLTSLAVLFSFNASSSELDLERSAGLAECYVLHAIQRGKVTDLTLRFKQKAYDTGSFSTVDSEINLVALRILDNQRLTGEIPMEYMANNFDLNKCFLLLNKKG